MKVLQSQRSIETHEGFPGWRDCKAGDTSFIPTHTNTHKPSLLLPPPPPTPPHHPGPPPTSIPPCLPSPPPSVTPCPQIKQSSQPHPSFSPAVRHQETEGETGQHFVPGFSLGGFKQISANEGVFRNSGMSSRRVRIRSGVRIGVAA